METVDINEYLKIAKKNLKNAGYDGDLEISNRFNKKLKYTDKKTGKILHFGDKLSKDFIIYTLTQGDKVAKIKQDHYKKRAKNVFNKTDKLSPSHLSWYVLW